MMQQKNHITNKGFLQAISNWVLLRHHSSHGRMTAIKSISILLPFPGRSIFIQGHQILPQFLSQPPDALPNLPRLNKKPRGNFLARQSLQPEFENEPIRRSDGCHFLNFLISFFDVFLTLLFIHLLSIRNLWKFKEFQSITSEYLIINAR